MRPRSTPTAARSGTRSDRDTGRASHLVLLDVRRATLHEPPHEPKGNETGNERPRLPGDPGGILRVAVPVALLAEGREHEGSRRQPHESGDRHRS